MPEAVKDATQIKNLAQLKRYLQLGRVIYMTWNIMHGDVQNRREVAKVQSNAVAFKVPDRKELSWLHWSKADHYTFDEKGFDVYEHRVDGSYERVLRYQYF